VLNDSNPMHALQANVVRVCSACGSTALKEPVLIIMGDATRDGAFRLLEKFLGMALKVQE
jgi:hypothetical protein